MDTESLWSFVVIAGPVILALVIAFALLRNRSRTPREVEQTETATRENYEEATAERRRRGE